MEPPGQDGERGPRRRRDRVLHLRRGGAARAQGVGAQRARGGADLPRRVRGLSEAGLFGARDRTADVARDGRGEADRAGGDDDGRRERGRGVRGGDRSAVPARQPPRIGGAGGGRSGEGNLVRGVPSLRDDGVPRRDRRGGGEPQEVPLHGEGAGRGDGAVLPRGEVLRAVAGEVDKARIRRGWRMGSGCIRT